MPTDDDTAKTAFSDRPEFRATIEVYDRIAACYRENWNDVVQPGLVHLIDGLAPHASVLDAGCGTGRDLAAFATRQLAPVGLDLSPAMLAQAHATLTRAGQPNVPLMVGDLRTLPLPDAAFDAVWASASLVHFDDHEAGLALEELVRVTRPGGQLHATVKHRRVGHIISKFADERWFRFWSPSEFADTAARAGWVVSSPDVEPDLTRPGTDWVVLRATAPTS